MPDGYRSLLAYWIGGAATAFPPDTQGALIIAGVDRTAWLKSNTGRFTRRFNARSGFSCQLEDYGRGYRPVVGSSLVVLLGSVRLFAGFIVSVRETRHPTAPAENMIQYSIEATDNNLIADRRLCYYPNSFGVIEYGPGFAGEIVRSIAARHLSGEGIDTTLVEDGPFLDAPLSLFFETVSAALNKVSQQTGFRWRIDEYKRLRFSEFGVTSAPFGITSTSPNWRNLSVTRDTANYRNRQFVRTETNLIGTKVETFIGDGATRDFFIGFVDPPSLNPQRFFSGTPRISLDGVPLTVGRMGPDDPADYDVMYDAPVGPSTMGGVGVHFQSPQSPPGDGAVLTVDYDYVLGNVVMRENVAQQSIRQGIEGGSGVWENVNEQRNVAAFQTLERIAEGNLSFYSLIPTRVEYELEEQGLEPGQIQHIDLPFHDVDEHLLIESIETEWHDAAPYQFRHRVNATDLGPLGGPESVLEKLAEVARIGVPRAAGALTELAIPGGSGDVPIPLFGRQSDGSAGNYLSTIPATGATLANYSGPFTVSCWFRVDAAQSGKFLFGAQAWDPPFTQRWWGIMYGAVGDSVSFSSQNYSGSNPASGTDAVISDTDWHHIAYRKSGSGAGEWAMFLDGAKTVVSASISFTLPADLFRYRAFRRLPGDEFRGALAHLSVWDVVVPDEAIAQMAARQRSDVAYPTRLLHYWPIDGTSDPEPNLGIHVVAYPLQIFGTLPPAS